MSLRSRTLSRRLNADLLGRTVLGVGGGGGYTGDTGTDVAVFTAIDSRCCDKAVLLNGVADGAIKRECMLCIDLLAFKAALDLLPRRNEGRRGGEGGSKLSDEVRGGCGSLGTLNTGGLG